MTRVDYTDRAHAYRMARTLPAEVLAAWTGAIVGAGLPRPGLVLDVGAGPGGFIAPLASWFGAPVVAIEPSPAMRSEARGAGVSPGRPYVAAWAEALPLRSGAAPAGLAWLSTMIHQCDDPGTVAAELRRVLGPGSRLLVRGFFSDMSITGLFGLFPGMDRSAATFPSTSAVVATFESAGFSLDAVHDVVEPWRTDLASWLTRVQSIRHTDSALRPLHDDEFAEGVRRVTERYGATPGPIPSDMTLRLVVLSG